MNYEAGMQAGKWYKKHQSITQPVTLYKCVAQTSFTFYCNAPFNYADSLTQLNIKPDHPLVLYGLKDEIDALSEKGYKVFALQYFEYFHISELTGKFINANTRQQQLQTFELAKVY